MPTPHDCNPKCHVNVAEPPTRGYLATHSCACQRPRKRGHTPRTGTQRETLLIAAGYAGVPFRNDSRSKLDAVYESSWPLPTLHTCFVNVYGLRANANARKRAVSMPPLFLTRRGHTPWPLLGWKATGTSFALVVVTLLVLCSQRI